MNLNRRNFLSMASTAGAMAITPFEKLVAGNAALQFADVKPAFKIPAGFSLKIMGSSWGFVGSVDAFCEKAKAAGYDGIEMWWPATKEAQAELFAAHIAKQYIDRHPEMRVTLDISHWCNVHESLLHDQENTVQQVLTEFGPPDYMPTLPYTRQPLANQWDINVYMMQMLRKRYQS